MNDPICRECNREPCVCSSYVDRLMKRCQVGVGGRNALNEAHSIMADCYGTLGRLQRDLAASRAEVARLTQCLKGANDSAEHFEREWYLRGDEVERLRQALRAITWNSRVRLRLNDLGWKIKNEEMRSLRLPDLERAEFLETELWDAARTFGPHLLNGCPLPFDSTEIEFAAFAAKET